MELGFHQKDLDSLTEQCLDGSFRRSRSGVSPDRKSEVSSSSKLFPASRIVFKGLKDYARKLVDIESFTQSPFHMDELYKLDYALEDVLFQQLFRMPYSLCASDDLKEDEYLALEDFLHASVEGLWRTFWHKSGSLPFFVSPSSWIQGLSGAALVAKSGNDIQGQWDQVLEFALFKPNILQGNELRFSAMSICEALFYGFHILLSRILSKYNTLSSDSVYLLVLDSKFGGVVKLTGDLGKLEVNTSNPYRSVAEWMRVHAELSVSPVDRIWNKLGNANWGDLGTLQLLLATFYSIVQCKGPPRKSIPALAADHSLRLQKRRIECHLIEGSNGFVSLQHSSHKEEIVELEHGGDPTYGKQTSCLKLKNCEVMMLEDHQGRKGFQIQETLIEGNCLSYSAVSLEHPGKLLTVYVGAHPSRLEPSWEDMSLWHRVQRHTKVLNILKQQGISSKYLPEFVASGRILHSGHCKKQSPGGRCDHPWCGTPILVTSPALRCCRDCLSALRSATTANIQHGDICPENIIRVIDTHGSRKGSRYVPVSWGRAVLEDRDSPAINLQFSSTYALQQGKLCPASDTESLVYLLYFVFGGSIQPQDSIESALQWQERFWTRRVVQQQLGEVSALLKALADYVDSLCGTPYPVDYDIWLKRLNRAVDGSEDRGKLVEEVAVTMRLEDVVKSSGTSGGCLQLP
ncbi:hypothetical protein NE237_017826 [Protea cynaroides]|uniref:Uncharacterized protein n=1 Tax=Protea cynaroides TaxID=273540 RepID=A0A9Q0K8S2_9MAGN|nr:hypothetical protein NE237_017826 [Protea cynaroides]